jgi:hypothetical protein
MMEVPASCCLLSALATQALVLRLLSHSGLFSINYFRNNNNKNGINFASRVPSGYIFSAPNGQGT